MDEPVGRDIAREFLVTALDAALPIPLAGWANSTIEKLTAERRRERERAVQRALLTEIWVLLGQPDGHQVEEAVRELLTDVPGPVVDNLVEGFESAHRTLDEEAIPYIARLMALYLVQGRRPDRVFREIGDLLKRADSTEIFELVRLFTELGSLFSRHSGRHDAIYLLATGRPDQVSPSVSLSVVTAHDGGGQSRTKAEVNDITESVLAMVAECHLHTSRPVGGLNQADIVLQFRDPRSIAAARTLVPVFGRRVVDPHSSNSP